MLENLFQQLNREHFSEKLPLPLLRWNPRLRTSAGRFSPGSRNPLRPRNPLIEVASYLRELEGGDKHIRDTLLHEMVHYLLWHEKKPYGHTPEFHSILKKVGASRYNPVPKLSPVKYWYVCGHCRVRIPARRKLSDTACLACCEKWNGGRFSSRYLLKILPAACSGELPAQTSAAPVAISRTEEKILPFAEVVSLLDDLKEQIKKAMLSGAPPSS